MNPLLQAALCFTENTTYEEQFLILYAVHTLIDYIILSMEQNGELLKIFRVKFHKKTKKKNEFGLIITITSS